MPDPRGLPTPSYVAPTPPPPTLGPTMTPTPGPMMTPATQSIAPPTAPAPPAITGEMARARTQEMPVPEEEPRPLSQWEFLGAKWTIDPTTAYQQYFEAGSSDRKRWDEDYDDYITAFGGGVVDGEAPPIFSPQEERMMADFENAIRVGEMDEGQAMKRLESYWAGEDVRSRRAEEAGRRGETLLAGAFPGPNLPLTGPGGMGEALSERYGVPNLLPAMPGTPLSKAAGVFGQTQQQMGLPETLGPITPPNVQLPNWGALGQAMPQFGGRNYFEELLREGRSTGF